MVEEVVDVDDMAEVSEATGVDVVAVIVAEADVAKWLREPSSLGGGNLHIFSRILLLNRRRCMLDSNQIRKGRHFYIQFNNKID